MAEERKGPRRSPWDWSSQDQWSHLWARMGVADAIAGYKELEALNRSPERGYHLRTRVGHCLEDFDAARHLARDPEAIELAIWLRDAVWSPRDPDAVVKSADWAAARIRSAGLPESLAQKVAGLIMAAGSPEEPADGDAHLFVDVARGVLGRPGSVYDNYEDDLRHGHASVPGSTYAAERVTTLRSWLARPTLYNTPFFREKYERSARSNLERRLRRLDLEAKGDRAVVEACHLRVESQRPFGDDCLAVWLYALPDQEVFSALAKLLHNRSPLRHSIRPPLLSRSPEFRDLHIRDAVLRLGPPGIYLCAHDAYPPAEKAVGVLQPEAEGFLRMMAFAREAGPIASSHGRVVVPAPGASFTFRDWPTLEEARADADAVVCRTEGERPTYVFNDGLLLVYQGDHHAAIRSELARLRVDERFTVTPWLDSHDSYSLSSSLTSVRRSEAGRDLLRALRSLPDGAGAGAVVRTLLRPFTFRSHDEFDQ